ncbi:MFS transporter [Streptomyces sp. NPDC049879]|uniref:MFS transporter n=1 Tax=Streptomyces sp. NPDC049879 TaxID=3365598 RepID=UPI00378B4CFE
MDTQAPVQRTGSEAARTTAGQWASVGVLSTSTFVVVTSEMLPVGVLTPMADGLGVSPGTAGFSLGVTGVVTAVAAPAVPRLLGALDRRAVLAVAMLVLAAGNALTASAQGSASLFLSRVVLGVGMGGVWGLAAAVAARLVAARDAALAVSATVGGVAAASVAGLPLGTLVGDGLGWRAAFASLAVVSVVLAAGLGAALPRLPRPAVSPGGEGPAGGAPLLRGAAVAAGLVAVAFLVTGHFAAYTYVRPLLEERTGLGQGTVALVLLLYGAFGLVGNFAAGALAARRARATVVGLAAGVCGALALLALLGSAAGPAVAGVALWGLAYGGVSVAGQIWMTQAAPHRVEQITGLYVGVFTGSIALGAFLGGVVVEGAGITPLLWSATALAAVSVAVGVLGRGAVPGARAGGGPVAASRDARDGAAA